MEDLEAAPGSPVVDDIDEPQGNDDPRDPLAADVEEENAGNGARTPPLADPTADTEAYDDDEAPETTATMRDQEDEVVSDHDNESELEELDEKEFEDFDPSALHLNIPDKPVPVDADNVGMIGVHKRKRTEEEERERKLKRKKEGRREKPKRKRVKAGEDGADEDGDFFEGGPEMEGKRARKSKAGADGRTVKASGGGARRARTPEDEENLTPEERRRRALDRKMDEALKTNRPSRRGKGVDLEAMADAEIESMRQRMAKACELDAEARSKGQVATHKLAILPAVTELLNRNTIASQLVDPDINLLEAVRFMLEPADHDAALPNYRIQRELFSAMAKLHIGKEALIASGIGKVVLFYTKSTQPQADIKRTAEKLVGEWMRVVLKKSTTKSSKPVEQRSYDPLMSSQQQASQKNAPAEMQRIREEKRRKALAMPIPGNRARVEGGLGTYTIAPVNTAVNTSGSLAGARNRGTGGEAFRRIAARSGAAAGKSGRR